MYIIKIYIIFNVSKIYIYIFYFSPWSGSFSKGMFKFKQSSLISLPRVVVRAMVIGVSRVCLCRGRGLRARARE